MNPTKRKRGRPKRFSGVKDRANFSQAVIKSLPAVVAFIEEWHFARDCLPRERGVDRYKEALDTVAAKHGLSPRTLERRYKELRFLAEPIAELRLSSANPPEIVIRFGQPPDD